MPLRDFIWSCVNSPVKILCWSDVSSYHSDRAKYSMAVLRLSGLVWSQPFDSNFLGRSGLCLFIVEEEDDNVFLDL